LIAALKIYTPDAMQEEWVWGQNYLARVYFLKALAAEGETRTQLFDAALKSSQAPLPYLDRAQLPDNWVPHRFELALQISIHAATLQPEDQVQLLDKSIRVYRSILEFMDSTAEPRDWAVIHSHLGETLQLLAYRLDTSEQSELLTESLAMFRVAVETLSPEEEPGLYAHCQDSIAWIHIGRSQDLVGDANLEALESARDAMQAALTVWTPEYEPDMHRTRSNVLQALERDISEGRRIQEALKDPDSITDWNLCFLVGRNCYRSGDTELGKRLEARGLRLAEEARVELDAELGVWNGADVDELNAIAWSLVDPDRESADSDVGLGLRLARAAVELGPEDAAHHDTLAWALVANGLHAEALTASETALRKAPAVEKPAYREYLARVKQAAEASK
ncbi:MAG: hypothetical protein KDB61_04115, partial [Planctomycetes bacterium]|nr:hypothetical protein [Planctomycetota bacterium]